MWSQNKTKQMPILIYRHSVIIKSDVYLYTLSKPTFLKPLYPFSLCTFTWTWKNTSSKSSINNDELLDIMYGYVIRVIRGKKEEGRMGRTRVILLWFEINKGITLVLSINVWKIGRIASQQNLASYFNQSMIIGWQ